jgi:hypothetical protein
MQSNFTHSVLPSTVQEYELLSSNFGAFHRNHVNILLHLLTTPLGTLGLISAILSSTNSTSLLVSVLLSYLALLIPAVNVGTFLGTAFLFSGLLVAARHLKIRLWVSLALIAVAYSLQDLSHWLTGEKTFQSSYSNGGQVGCSLSRDLLIFTILSQIDFFDFDNWSRQFTEHCLFLLPLCVDLVLPAGLDYPFPQWVAVFRNMYWIFAPAVFLTIGSFCLDSKNAFCFFPAGAYYCRVVTCNIAKPDDENSQKENLASIRKWAMAKNPPPDMSSHYWYRDLPAKEMAAFHSIASCHQIANMFRSLFSEKHVS